MTKDRPDADNDFEEQNREDRTDRTDFEQWFKSVDTEVERLCGMSIQDLEDYDYRTAFEMNVTPADCALEVLRAQNF
jgi:hypothetical protein